MEKILKCTNVRELLALKYEATREKNAGYSLRAFAKDLQLTPSHLSRVLNGRAGLSDRSAGTIAERLQLSEEEATHLANLVRFEYSRSKAGRRVVREKVLTVKPAFTSFEKAAFQAVSEWYHLPLACLVELPKFKEDTRWIARRLNIPVRLVKPAIERLIEVKVLRRDRDGNLQSTGSYFANLRGLPSRAVRSFHKDILLKAIDSIEGQNTHERVLSALVLTVDDDQIPEVQVYIKKFLDEFKVKFSSDLARNKQVYALSLQYFGLTVSEEETQ